MKAENLQTGKTKYFVDKCLPFGASISCAIFQVVSDALKHIIEFRAKAYNTVTDYLDDFLFLAYTLELCNQLIMKFLQLSGGRGTYLREKDRMGLN